MPELGRRFLAPTAQGTGDGLTVGNAAAAADRLTLEAALHAAAVADGALKASGTPADVAIEMCWRADLGAYTLSDSTVYAPNGTHGGVSATRKLRHISVNAAGVKIAASVVRNHSTLTTTASGEANVVQFVGTRTADPRTSGQKLTHAVNVSPAIRYCKTLAQDAESQLQPGQMMHLTTAVVTDPGTGAWNWGNFFEISSGSYGWTLWDGFKWSRFQIPFSWGGGSSGTDFTIQNVFFDNIKNFCRNSTSASLSDITINGVYGRSFAQTCFRIDYCDQLRIANFDIDNQFQVGDRITNATTFGVLAQATPTVYDPIVEDFLIKNCWDASVTLGQYQQGDGIDAEDSCVNMIVRRGVVDTVGDGGVDVKVGAADPTRPAFLVEDVDLYRAGHFNIRTWGGRGNGLYNLRQFINVRSFYPHQGHIQITGETFDWENPDGGVAMTDTPGHSTIAIDALDLTLGHILVTLRDLTHSRDVSSPAINNHDNTASYPTIGEAEAAGAKQIRIQQVTGAGWAGTVEVDGVTYTGDVLEPDETVTNRIHITGASGGQVTFTLLPAGAGELTPIDSTTADVTWADTDGAP